MIDIANYYNRFDPNDRIPHGFVIVRGVDEDGLPDVEFEFETFGLAVKALTRIHDNDWLLKNCECYFGVVDNQHWAI